LIDKVKKKLLELMEEAGPKGDKKIVIIDPESLLPLSDVREPDMRTIGLFGDVAEEKVAELIQALLYLNELNKIAPEEEEHRPIEFYVSTYGGNADDMFALFDIMTLVKKETDIQTIGLGKVMSAGVLILAAGTKGQRRIGKNCRVMIHNVRYVYCAYYFIVRLSSLHIAIIVTFRFTGLHNIILSGLD